MTHAVTHDDGASPVVLEFEDNQLLPLLYGDFDRHLARIEQALEVTIASRGNTVTITGEAAATEIARVCLESLYRRLVDGLEVSAGEVDAAVRLARAQRPKDGTVWKKSPVAKRSSAHPSGICRPARRTAEIHRGSAR